MSVRFWECLDRSCVWYLAGELATPEAIRACEGINPNNLAYLKLTLARKYKAEAEERINKMSNLELLKLVGEAYVANA